MKNFAIPFILACLISVSRGAVAQNISMAELSIGGIAIGQTEQDVVKRLGTPSKRENTGEGYLLAYPGFEVYVGVGSYGVFEVVSRNPEHCTPSKVCPGMPISGANRIYGAPVVASRESGTYFEYTPEGNSCWLQVSAPKDIILSMRIACQP